MADYLNPKITKKFNKFNALRKIKQAKGLDDTQTEELFVLSTSLIQFLVDDLVKMKKQLLMQNAELEKLRGK